MIIVIEGGQHQDPGAGTCGEDPCGGGDAVHARHPQVHQHDIRSAPIYQLDSLVPVFGLVDDLEIIGCRTQHPQPGPYQVLIVDRSSSWPATPDT